MARDKALRALLGDVDEAIEAADAAPIFDKPKHFGAVSAAVRKLFGEMLNRIDLLDGNRVASGFNNQETRERLGEIEDRLAALERDHG